MGLRYGAQLEGDTAGKLAPKGPIEPKKSSGHNPTGCTSPHLLFPYSFDCLIPWRAFSTLLADQSLSKLL